MNTHSTTDGQQFNNYYGNTAFRDCAVVTTTYDPPKPLREFIQVDGWANYPPGDSVMVPDGDGDVLMGGRTREPQRSGTTVRIHIAADAQLDDALRIIRKQIEWLELKGLSIGVSHDDPWS
jgi:hypothetical protein